MNTDTVLEPKLRFKSFSRAWGSSDFRDLFDEKTAKAGNKAYELLSVSVKHGVTEQSKSIKADSSSSDKSKYKVLNIGDIAYNTMRMWQGASGVSKLHGIISPAYTIVKPKNGCSVFYGYFLKLPRVVFNCYRYSQGLTSDTWNLKFKHFAEISGVVPVEIAEQQKIADFLTTVDDWITNLEAQKEKLEAYKRGVMQRIFSQAIRFKDDRNDFPEWEEKQLKDILTEQKERNNALKYNEVFSVAKEAGVINQIKHLGRSYAADNISNYKVVNEGDVIYTKSPTADFPFGIVKQNQLKRSGVVSTLYAVYKPLNWNIGYFLHSYFLSWENTYNYLIPLISKGAKNTINMGNTTFLEGKKFKIPTSEKEQQMITDFLSGIDRQIEAKQSEIDKAKQWKKGLMQQMFV